MATIEVDIKERVEKGLENKIERLKKMREEGVEIKREDKVQVLVLADSPTVVTGFGNVARNVLQHMHDTGLYAIEIVGINYDGAPHDFPFRIWPAVNALIEHPAYREPYGRQKFLDLLIEGRFDLAWVLQDSFIVAQELGEKIQECFDALPADMKFQWMFYYPIDAKPDREWIEKSVALAHFPVVYTQYGYNESINPFVYDPEDKDITEEDRRKLDETREALTKRLSIVYHGINTKEFYPLEDTAKVARMRAGLWTERNKDKFVFMNVNRNQPRKDLFNTLKAYKILKDRRKAKGMDDVYLYMHCNIFDNGMDLLRMSQQIQLVSGQDWAFPDPKMFGPSTGFPVSRVNELYNAIDAVVTTSLGEGWGLSLTEAMAVKKPIIAPNHTSTPEILGNGERGLVVKTSGSFVQQNDNARVRPLTDAEDLANKMEWLVEHRAEFQPIVDAAYAWVKQLEWSGPEVGGKWETIFAQAYAGALKARTRALDENVAMQLKAQKLGRNEMCPVCKIKYKQCRHWRD